MSKQANNAAKIRTRRTFRNALTFETTALRYNPETGTVSRPERAGQDVGPHVFVRGATLDACRMAWKHAQAELIEEGFEITGTERY